MAQNYQSLMEMDHLQRIDLLMLHSLLSVDQWKRICIGIGQEQGMHEVKTGIVMLVATNRGE